MKIHTRNNTLSNICELQADVGDIDGALKTFDMITNELNARLIDDALEFIAEDQAWYGDSDGAMKTANRIKDTSWHRGAVVDAVKARRRRVGQGVVVKAVKSEQAIQMDIPVIKTVDWLKKLDEGHKWDSGYDYEWEYHNGHRVKRYRVGLNRDQFVNLTGYVAAQHEDNPRSLFAKMIEVANTLIIGQNMIEKMVKDQAAQ